MFYKREYSSLIPSVPLCSGQSLPQQQWKHSTSCAVAFTAVMLLLSKNGIDSTVGASEVPVFVRSLRVVTRFTLTWWVPADIAGVSVWNIVLQQAHAGAMLPAQTVFTLKGGEKNTTLYNRQTLWWNKHLQCLEKKNPQEVIKKGPPGSWSHSLPPLHRYIALSPVHWCPQRQSPDSEVVLWRPDPRHSRRRSTHNCQWTSHWCYPHLQSQWQTELWILMEITSLLAQRTQSSLKFTNSNDNLYTIKQAIAAEQLSHQSAKNLGLIGGSRRFSSAGYDKLWETTFGQR